MDVLGTPSGWSGRHAVELYVRTYNTMLQSSGEIRLASLAHAHIAMESVLHPLAAESRVDMGALIYSVRRLPAISAWCRERSRMRKPNRCRSARWSR